MLWGFFVCGLIVVALALLLRMRVKIEVTYDRVLADDDATLVVSSLFGLIRIRRKLRSVDTKMTRDGPRVNVEHESERAEDEVSVSTKDVFGLLSDLDHWIRLAREITPITRRALAHVHVRTLSLEGTVGMGNAMLTGTTVGAVSSLLYTLLGAVSYLLKFHTMPTVQFKPEFQFRVFLIHGHSIMDIRLGHAMFAALRVLLVLRKGRTYHGASDSRSHANGHGKYS